MKMFASFKYVSTVIGCTVYFSTHKQLKTTPPPVANEQEAEDNSKPLGEKEKESKEAPVEVRGEGDGEEREPMIDKDAVNVGMEVIEEGEEESAEDEKPKTQ